MDGFDFSERQQTPHRQSVLFASPSSQTSMRAAGTWGSNSQTIGSGIRSQGSALKNLDALMSGAHPVNTSNSALSPPFTGERMTGLRNRRTGALLDTQGPPAFALSPPMTGATGPQPATERNPDTSVMSFEDDMPPAASLLSVGDMTSPYLQASRMGTPANAPKTHDAGGRTPLALPMPSDIRWQDWVVVFGFQPEQSTSVLRYFQRFGDIVEHHRGKGNWLFIRYRSRMQAQKAVAQNGATLDPTLMVAVAALSPSRAAELGFDLDENGTARVEAKGPPEFSRGGSVVFSPHGNVQAKLKAAQEWGALTSSRRRYDALGADGDEDIMQPAVKKRNVCQRIMALLFNW